MVSFRAWLVEICLQLEGLESETKSIIMPDRNIYIHTQTCTASSQPQAHYVSYFWK